MTSRTKARARGSAPGRIVRIGLTCVSTLAVLVSAGCTPEDSASSDSTSQDAAAAAASAATTGSDATSAAGSQDSDAASGTSTATPIGGAAGAVKSTSSRRLYRVIRVVDGDTVKVDMNGGERVRVIGINAPESVDPNRPVECGGPAASAAAKKLLEGKRVALVFDKTQARRDKYNRVLAYVEIPRTGDFGKIMLTQGHAREVTYAAPYQRRPAYRAAERQARAAHRGIWGTCATQQPTSSSTSAPAPTTSSPAPAPAPTPAPAPSPKPAPQPKPKPSPAPAPPPPPAPTAPADPGPGWTNDALTPGYTGCRQGYPGGRINGVYWWKPIAC